VPAPCAGRRRITGRFALQSRDQGFELFVGHGYGHVVEGRAIVPKRRCRENRAEAPMSAGRVPILEDDELRE
jgi:hypothetical protein